jgi:predicted glycoside hydrolase/deacetylase ChbG (UPF0249 family)
MELEAQLACLTGLGVKLTHLDGHQHVHVLPGILEVVLATARRLGLAVRMPVEEFMWNGRVGRGLEATGQVTKKLAFWPWALRARTRARTAGVPVNDHFRSPFSLFPPLKIIDRQVFNRLLMNLRPGVTELMVHPALEDDGAYLWDFDSRLVTDRAREAAVLSDPWLTERLGAGPARLISYQNLVS